MQDFAAMTERLKSDPNANPVTGADLGGGPGAGKLSDEDLGGASDMADARSQAAAKRPFPSGEERAGRVRLATARGREGQPLSMTLSPVLAAPPATLPAGAA